MNTLVFEPRARIVRFDTDNPWVELTNGQQLGVPLVYFPRLLKADQSQRERYVIRGGGTGPHWDDLDEDISVESLLLGMGDRTRLAWKAS